MKRGGPDHPKTHALAAELGLEVWQAVGLLEVLWHWAGRYARRGDVGRFSNQVVAHGVGWKGDPAVLVQALIQTRFLDPCRCHRLRIHDWPDHADQAVRKTKEVLDNGFLECYGDPPAALRRKGGRRQDTRTPVPAQDSRHRTHGTGNGRTEDDARVRELATALQSENPGWSETLAIAQAKLRLLDERHGRRRRRRGRSPPALM